MRIPRDFDAVDLLYAAESFAGWRPLKSMGLNRRGYRGAKKARDWLIEEFIKSVDRRKKQIKK